MNNPRLYFARGQSHEDGTPIAVTIAENEPEAKQKIRNCLDDGNHTHDLPEESLSSIKLDQVWQVGDTFIADSIQGKFVFDHALMAGSAS